MIRAGHPGWTGFGGHGSGRKLPIVFAGLLLGEDDWARVNTAFPKVSFGEDEQTAYGRCAGPARRSSSPATRESMRPPESAANAATAWGPYEHLPPSQWKAGQNTSESYRRCCTSVGWVAQALALRLMHAEKAWGHDAFFDYVDRWMYENDANFVKTIKRRPAATTTRNGPARARPGTRSSTRCGPRHRRRSTPDRRLEENARRQLLPHGDREVSQAGTFPFPQQQMTNY